MMRYNCQTHTREEVPAVDAFIADIEAICAKHMLAISHEDIGGAFEIVPLSKGDPAWFREAIWKP